MKQNKILNPLSIAVFLILAIGVYFYFFSKPTEFLSEDSLIESIRSFDGGSYDVEIQDIVYLSDTHVFVPYRSDGRFGSSQWVWKNRSWEMRGVGTIENPNVWQVDPDDPSTYFILWNIAPDSEMTEFDIYLTNRRGYWVSNDVHQYTPRVQLHFNVDFKSEEKSYGVRALPEEWVTYLDGVLKVTDARQPDASFDTYHQSGVTFAWMPYNEFGEITFPDSPHGSRSGHGQLHFYHLSTIPEYELE